MANNVDSVERIPAPTLIIRVAQAGVHADEAPTEGLASVPIIDGKLDDFCWQKASRISGFNSTDGRQDIDQQTTVYLLYNVNFLHWTLKPMLYTGFKCYNSRMDELKRVGGFDPIPCVDREDLKVSLSMGDRTLRPCWYSQHSFGKDYWTEEREVPTIELMGRAPKEGDILNLSLSRNNEVFDEKSGWNGNLVFGGPSDPVCEISTFGGLSMGKNAAEIEVINNSDLPVTVEATIDIFPISGVEYKEQKDYFFPLRAKRLSHLLLSGKPYSSSTHIKLKSREVKKANVDYTLREEGEHYLTFTLSSPKTEKLYLRTGFIFTIAPNKEKLTNLRAQLDKLKDEVSVSPQRVRRELENEFDILGRELSRLNLEATKTPTKGSWQLLTEKVKALEIRMGKFGHKIRSYKVYKRRRGVLEYALGVETNLVKLRQDKPFSGEITDTVRISACGNEFEGFQVVILPFEKDLKNIEVKVTDIVNREKGTKISSKNIEINAVGYVKTKRPRYKVKYVGWWPDPLTPLKEPYFSGAKANQMLQPIWVTVYVPPDTPAGKYQGMVTVSPSNSHPLKVNLLMNVWSFNLPKETHIKTFWRFQDKEWSGSATGSELDVFRKFYNRKFTPELYREWCAFHLKHRIGQANVGIRYISKVSSPNGSYDYSIVDENLEFCLERGLNVFDIIGMFYLRGQLSPEGIKEMEAFLADYSKHLKEKGWFDMAVAEPYNESSAEAFPVAKEYMKTIKNAVPDLKILQKGGGERFSYWTDGAKNAGTLDLCDVWCPGGVPPSSRDEAIKERHAAGDECWAYHDYLDTYIDRPAVNLRKIWWRAWARNLDGLAYWATMAWSYNLLEGREVKDKWPNRPWHAMCWPGDNGEGYLLYPGPEGYPLSSIRLEIIRDAAEDYEYLYLLRELIQKIRKKKGRTYQNLINTSELLLDIDHSLTEPVTPRKIYQLRERIAIQIERIKQILEQK